MISSNEKTIFGKVAYLICEEILKGNYNEEDRIPACATLPRPTKSIIIR